MNITSKTIKLFHFINSIKIIKEYSLILFILFMVGKGLFAQTGTWSEVSTLAPHTPQGGLQLLTDGTVLCHNNVGGKYGEGWDRLTPNSSGSYANGTWTTIASMNYDRLFFQTQILVDGRLFASGGEYGSGDTAGEIYNSLTNVWTKAGWSVAHQNLYDGNSENLANNTILIGAQYGSNPSFDCLFYTPSTNEFTNAPISPLNHDEAQWVKLPDGSILFVGIASQQSCRYIPATNSWVMDANVPVKIYDTYGEESGGALLLPNGKAIFFGATPENAIYTPSGNSNPGTWAAAAKFPVIDGDSVGQTDAPAAMMVNGKILCAVSPVGNANSEFNSPTWFLEYDYTTNTFTKVTAKIPGYSGDSIPEACYLMNMIDLPNGTVLLNIDQVGIEQYYIYTPGSGPIAAGKPVINSIYQPNCSGNYYITGKLFNGISEGAAYGDDWQMETNYPIIRLTNGSNVYYARTSYWNRIGAVQTDSLEDSAQFTLPAGLPAATYSLVVVANGFASSPTLFNPNTSSPLTATAAVLTSVSCNGGSNGSASVTVSGGNSPFTYLWSNGAITSSINNLKAGTYSVTVSNGCTATASITITQPSALTASVTLNSNASCGSSNGSATANPAGGTSPYMYLWNDPLSQTSEQATGLSTGKYTVTITDNNSCTASATINISSGLATSITVNSNVSCNGGNNGSATANASGGASPYSYSWNTSPIQLNQQATGLSAGNYIVTATDNNGCTGTASTTITQPALLAITIKSETNVSCNGGSNGSISISATGGTSPYNYSWNNSNTTTTITGLPQGSFTVTVTDANQCTASTSVVVTQPLALSLTVSKVNVTCGGTSTGTGTATVSGGTSPYTYKWSDGVTKSSVTNFPAGSYTITVTDHNSCSISASISITSPAALNLTSHSAKGVLCNGQSNGTATINPTGGTSPYTYSWNSKPVKTTQTASGLSAGTYSVTVTDNKGCSGTASISITAPVKLTVTLSSKCSGGKGSITPTVAGGSTPYSYTWSNGGTSSSKTGLSNSTYTVTVSDHNDCSASATIRISCAGEEEGPNNQGDAQECCDDIVTGKDIALFPNPTSGLFTIAGLPKQSTILVYNMLGQTLNLPSLSGEGVSGQMILNISSQPDGMYLLRIIGADGNLIAERTVIKSR